MRCRRPQDVSALWLRLTPGLIIHEQVEQFVFDFQLGDAFGSGCFGFGRNGDQQGAVGFDLHRIVPRLRSLDEMNQHDTGNLFSGRGIHRQHAAMSMRATERVDDQLLWQVDVVGVLGGSGRLVHSVQSA